MPPSLPPNETALTRTAYAAWLERYGELLLDHDARTRWRAAAADDDLRPWADEVEALAESFLDKRVDELRRAVPLTLRVAPSVAGRYRRWLATHPAHGDIGVLTPGLAEGLRAATAVAAALQADSGEVEYAPALLHYEVRSGASKLDGVVRFQRADVPLHEIVAALVEGSVPVEPEPDGPWVYRYADRVSWRRA